MRAIFIVSAAISLAACAPQTGQNANQISATSDAARREKCLIESQRYGGTLGGVAVRQDAYSRCIRGQSDRVERIR